MATNYSPITDFSVKDGLAAGNPNKAIQGSEWAAEFESIKTSVSKKWDTAGTVAANSGAFTFTTLTSSGNNVDIGSGMTITKTGDTNFENLYGDGYLQMSDYLRWKEKFTPTVGNVLFDVSTNPQTFESWTITGEIKNRDLIFFQCSDDLFLGGNLFDKYTVRFRALITNCNPSHQATTQGHFYGPTVSTDDGAAEGLFNIFSWGGWLWSRFDQAAGTATFSISWNIYGTEPTPPATEQGYYGRSLNTGTYHLWCFRGQS